MPILAAGNTAAARPDSPRGRRKHKRHSAGAAHTTQTSPQQHSLDPAEELLLWAGLRVRIGIHCGDAKREKNPTTKRYDYFGPGSDSVHVHNNDITTLRHLRHYDITTRYDITTLRHFSAVPLRYITTLRHYDIATLCGPTTLRHIATHCDTLRHVTTLRHYDSQDGWLAVWLCGRLAGRLAD